MKVAGILPLTALAAAFVLPEPEVFRQVATEDHRADDASWWDKIPTKDSIVSTLEDGIDSLSAGVETFVESIDRKFRDGFEQAFVNEEDEDDDTIDIEIADRPKHGHHHHSFNLTIYEIISKSNHTKKFVELVNEYDDIVDLLNSTTANYTLFVPVDSAFEHIPDDKKPSKEFVESVLKYHIGLGLYPAGRILKTHTLPTALNESWLGDKPQRLRTSVGLLSGIRVNFYSKVVVANVGAKNGVIHAVKSILVPPPPVGRELSLLPSEFSTLLLAYEKTDFVKFIHGVKITGSTVFAPSNDAFSKLGPRANAFLFNTEKGLKFLTALLKYQIVANTTLYSDAIYESEGEAEVDTSKHYHIDLPSLLGGKNIAVDVTKWGGFTKIKLNGWVPVVLQDGIAKNGVIQVVGRVPIPPHKHHKEEENDGEIEVEDLIERLADYVDDEDSKPELGDL